MKRARANALREQKAALRARLAERKQAAQAELERRRAALKKKEDPRKKRRWWPTVLAIILLLLLHDCRCNEVVLPEAPAELIDGAGGVGQAVEPVPEPPPEGRTKRRERPAFPTADPAPLPWITALRMQVAARSPRLAACFVGAQRPGALKWTAAVEPSLGRVSDQTFEPMLSSEQLTRAQRDCAADVLGDPAYMLESDKERSTPARVGMVIEF